MRKFGIILIILTISHVLFFIVIDRNRAIIKAALVKSGIWNSNLYVFFQQKLTKKDSVVKKLSEEFYSNLPKEFSTNHFNETHEIYDLEKILINNNKNLDIGYITSLEKHKNIIKIISNNGYVFFLNDNFQFINYLDISKYFKNFYTDYAYGGIRGVKWISEDKLVIYTTSQENEIYKLTVLLAEINDNYNLKIIDKLNLENLPNQDGTTSNLGGGIEYNNGKIYLTIGTGAKPNEYKINEYAQNEDSNLGKILEISINEQNQFNKVRKIAKGSRNSQGLLFLDDTLIAVEHGPQGGDEINKIDINNNGVTNLGWPNYSYGLPYHNDVSYANSKEEKGNLKKNLDKFYDDFQNDFQEPLFYFTPSIAVSHIAKCPFEKTNFKQYRDCFVISSLKDRSFYIVKFQKYLDEIKIQSVEKIFTANRIRKIYTELNSIYICLDNLKIIKINYKIFN